MAARLLAEEGHQVTLHARNDARAADRRDTAGSPNKSMRWVDLTR
jgi:hypothetical protein